MRANFTIWWSILVASLLPLVVFFVKWYRRIINPNVKESVQKTVLASKFRALLFSLGLSTAMVGFFGYFVIGYLSLGKISEQEYYDIVSIHATVIITALCCFVALELMLMTPKIVKAKVWGFPLALIQGFVLSFMCGVSAFGIVLFDPREFYSFDEIFWTGSAFGSFIIRYFMFWRKGF